MVPVLILHADRYADASGPWDFTGNQTNIGNNNNKCVAIDHCYITHVISPDSISFSYLKATPANRTKSGLAGVVSVRCFNS